MLDFLQHRADYLAQLRPFTRFLPYQAECYNPYPLVLERTLYQDLQNFANTLMLAIKAIAENYLQDEGMQDAMPLSEAMRRFLALSSAVSYRPGTMRPDLLFGASGEVKVCEINARFPLNGMAMSQWLVDAAVQSPFLDWQHYEPVKTLSDIQPTILARFSTDTPLVRVASSETGSESLYFLETFKRKGGTVLHVRPEDLQLQDKHVVVNDDNSAVSAHQFILEIDREELRLFSDDVISHIIQHCNYINDVRTLILVHDKRILSVLANSQIMSAYLSHQQLALLNRFLTQSLDLSDEQNLQEVLDNRERWVIKKISGGRGVDLYVGQQCEPEFWRDILTRQRNDFMAQQFIPPGAVSMVALGEEQAETKNMHFVGALPCFDGECFGLGMFRASEKLCVNIGDGKGHSILLPSAVSRSAEPEKLHNSVSEPGSPGINSPGTNSSGIHSFSLNHIAWQAVS